MEVITMSTAVIDGNRQSDPVAVPTTSDPAVVVVKRRTIDSVLIGFGVVATAAFLVAGFLLSWGHDFSSDYVTRGLSSQNITFPSPAELTTEGRADLGKFADHKLDTGKESEGYASFINGLLAKIADGSTYADLGAPE